MKKFLAVILTAAMILSVASCGGKKEETTTAPETTPQVTEPATEATTEETTEAASEETSEEAPTEEEAPSEEEDGEETETKRLANVILNCGIEFPANQFMEGTKDEIKEFLGYDLTDAEEYSIVTNLMSVHLLEITIIKVQDGKMDAVMEMLEARKKDLIENYAFYPAQEEAANATVVGNKNGYAYLICDARAAEAEAALLEAIA